MKIPEQAFLVGLVWLAVFFQIGMWRELRQGTKGRSFYRFGLIFCCCMEALSLHNFALLYTQSAALAVTGSVIGALACLGIAYGVAHAPRRRGPR